MPSVKNKWVRPGSAFSYPGGQRVYNNSGADLPKNTIVYLSGTQGNVATVAPSDGATPTLATQNGRLLVLRHAIPQGKYGIGQPWAILSGLTLAAASQTPLYADVTGQITLVAGGVGTRIIGYILNPPSSPVAADGTAVVGSEAAL
jgi:hypothetical protein